jgi:uncharacterized protein
VLIRLVRHPDSGELVIDLPGKLPGRGAWVHATSGCLARAEKQSGRLVHALKGPVLAAGLSAAVRAKVSSAALDGLSMAAASGSLVGGHDRLRAALVAGEVAVVAVAAGASERTIASLREVAGETPFIAVDLDSGALGERLGRGARAAVGVLHTRGAAHALRWLRRLADLG